MRLRNVKWKRNGTHRSDARVNGHWIGSVTRDEDRPLDSQWRYFCDLRNDGVVGGWAKTRKRAKRAVERVASEWALDVILPHLEEAPCPPSGGEPLKS